MSFRELRKQVTAQQRNRAEMNDVEKNSPTTCWFWLSVDEYID